MAKKSKKNYHNDLSKSFNSLSSAVSTQVRSINQGMKQLERTLERYGIDTGKQLGKTAQSLADRVGVIEDYLTLPWYRKLFRKFRV